ncbi:DUF732 domain-containing protein [Mycobacterium manitobense]|uniref:DUF732 domain-containing protein n=1 Tax=[Mycobacterium] manitobense TaxID=190147 RepID=A0A9X2YKM0_9MYCO|nr:DUF732 domain-containing protein [[Mycobacterium] manitobense]MCV7168906.1 DUF732 domain-containing protein [[Mycobacterium] manitobense]
MIRHCRTVAVAVAVAGFAVWGQAGIAGADTNDDRFQKVITEMGLKGAPGTDLPAMGRAVCDAITQQLAANPNPAPVVRGVVSTLENSNMTREEAVGFMRASVAVYCPQHRRFTGR